MQSAEHLSSGRLRMAHILALMCLFNIDPVTAGENASIISGTHAQLELSSQITALHTARVYTATLQSENMFKYFCEESSTNQILAIDAPTIYAEIIKHQTNSLVAIINKTTGEKFYALAKVNPAIKVWYDKDGLAVGFVLLKKTSVKTRILNLELGKLVDKISSWKIAAEPSNCGVIYVAQDAVVREKLKADMRPDGFDLQFSYLQQNNEWHRDLDLDVVSGGSNRLRHDFKFTNLAGSEAVKISDKNTDKFIAIAYAIILNDLVKSRNNISDLKLLNNDETKAKVTSLSH